VLVFGGLCVGCVLRIYLLFDVWLLCLLCELFFSCVSDVCVCVMCVWCVCLEVVCLCVFVCVYVSYVWVLLFGFLFAGKGLGLLLACFVSVLWFFVWSLSVFLFLCWLSS